MGEPSSPFDRLRAGEGRGMAISFAHPSEVEYGELLDAHGIPWE
jgi:hypothetical protein